MALNTLVSISYKQGLFPTEPQHAHWDQEINVSYPH